VAGTLRIDVTGAGLPLSVSQRQRVVRRVLLALSRFGPHIHKVSVRVAELANPLGGLDRRCRMRAWLLAQDGNGIRVEVINGRVEAAVGRAATRLAARVAYALDGGSGGAAHPIDSGGRRGGGGLAPGTPAGPRRRSRSHPPRRARLR
jgi:hypothetical protein